MSAEQTLKVVQDYYESWRHGPERYDAERLERVLHPRLSFEGPLGKKDKAEDFLVGLARFGKTVKSVRMLQSFAAGDEAAAVYDCDLAGPVSTLRCTEIFRVDAGRIVSIRLVYDASAYKTQA